MRTAGGGATPVPGVGAAPALLALLLLTACSPTATDARDSRTPTTASTSTSAAPSAAPVTPARRASSVVRPQRPVSVVLPGAVVVPVRRASTTAAGLLDVPADTGVAGWWDGGARIGDPFGSTLVAAHVDSRTQGLGPFAALLRLEGGERVRVRSAGLVQDFEVRARRLVPQGPLTARTGLFTPSGPRRLTLVTCAPPYVAGRGGYQNLAVVTAVPVGPPSRRPRP